jgi:hypothetical protein
MLDGGQGRACAAPQDVVITSGDSEMTACQHHLQSTASPGNVLLRLAHSRPVYVCGLVSFATAVALNTMLIALTLAALAVLRWPVLEWALWPATTAGFLLPLGLVLRAARRRRARGRRIASVWAYAVSAGFALMLTSFVCLVVLWIAAASAGGAYYG